MILSGKEVSSALRAGLAAQVATFPEKYGRAPHLAVILVGDNPASQIYVRNKAKACESIGITNTTITMPADSTEEAVLAEIKRLNEDSGVDGILVQLPVPKQINTARIIEAIAREKDVDGFHPGNVAALWQKMPCMVPCTPKGIMKLLAHAGVDPKGKRAVVIGRSNIVGLPVAKLLLDANATVTMCHTRTVDLPSITRQAEILVVAAGAAKMVTGDMVSDGCVVIDVGMDHDAEGKLCGDVDYDSVAPKASWITPVPGGVGPMTIACLMENTVEAFLAKQK
ncbi:MAG: bifunctional methylenetetrahydrofolate dehydrogenase/methenyltetrahydrofolate cyclohydrolase FolD [Bacteroidales bacterium]|nr:bifunctional methylenetetrahydrofolate dehydrogenase/methenyltetrahydrofolate cyclohydrolase FolD [Bacteroidales bacterium]